MAQCGMECVSCLSTLDLEYSRCCEWTQHFHAHRTQPTHRRNRRKTTSVLFLKSDMLSYECHISLAASEMCFFKARTEQRWIFLSFGKWGYKGVAEMSITVWCWTLPPISCETRMILSAWEVRSRLVELNINRNSKWKETVKFSISRNNSIKFLKG